MLAMNNSPEQDVAEFIFAKGYVPISQDLPKAKIIKNSDDDVTYLLSKLSDEELFKLLSDQPNKNEFIMNDLVKLKLNTKHGTRPKPTLDTKQNTRTFNAKIFSDASKMKRFQTVTHKSIPEKAFFRLENKEIDPYAVSKGAISEHKAVQKINNLLYSRPTEIELENQADIDEEKKELLFDVLVAQLKSLCCKRNKSLKNNDKSKLRIERLLNHILQEIPAKKDLPAVKTPQFTRPNEYMFLILNDEIKSTSNEKDDLISVDPESLGKNSSAMLLGPITTPMSDTQLKLVMMRISNELSKIEYQPLLQQISDGTLSNEHKALIDSIVHGPQTRRYIKPHRCNHQSPLAHVYGGPKWLICTGYLNINKPSLYD